MTDSVTDPVELIRRSLDPQGVWIVGGAVRDGHIGREVLDVDLVVSSDPADCAKQLTRANSAAAFPLSEEFGTWRVVPREGNWQVDISPMQGATIEEDLSRRDFTINAMAVPLAGGETIDPFGGADHVGMRLLEAVGEESFSADPLRVVRLARFASDLGFRPSDSSVELAMLSAAGLSGVSGERVLTELLAILVSERASDGLRLLDSVRGLAAVLPELVELQGVEQSVYHHLDCYDHTLAVLDSATRLQQDPSRLGRSAGEAAGLMGQGFADGVDRWGVLRVASILHDIAKSSTRTVFPDGRIGFPDHDRIGATVSVAVLTRLRASGRLRDRVAAMVRWHLSAGFLTHSVPLSRRDIHRYLIDCGEAAVDVTVLSAADRLATLGRHSEEAIARHLEVVDVLLSAAVEREVNGDPEPLVRGDALADALGIEPGQILGRALAEIASARYAGEVETEGEAIDHASSWLQAEADLS